MWVKVTYAVLAVILLVAVELMVGWARLLEPWGRAAPAAIAGAALLLLLTYAIRSARLFRFYPDCKVSAMIAAMLKTLPKSRSKLFESWGWTTLNWGMKLFSFAWILTIFTPINFADSVFGAAGGELSTVLPINAPAGIGTYEAGVVAAMMPLGVKLQHAIIGGVNLHLFVLGMAVIGGLLSFLVPRRRANQSSAAA